MNLPEPDLTLPSVKPDGPDGAHYYRASTVQALLAGRREQCITVCERLGRQYKDEPGAHALERAVNAIRLEVD